MQDYHNVNVNGLVRLEVLHEVMREGVWQFPWLGLERQVDFSGPLLEFFIQYLSDYRVIYFLFGLVGTPEPASDTWKQHSNITDFS